jgi:hypothetical protein
MPQCQFPIFCYFCVSEKLHRKYSWNWTKQKPKFLFFPARDGVQSRDGGEPGARHTLGRRGQPLAHATRGCGLLAHLLMPLLLLYILLDEKTLRSRSIFQKHITSYHHRQPKIRRVQKLFPAPFRRGESWPKAFFITMPASGVMCA